MKLGSTSRWLWLAGFGVACVVAAVLMLLPARLPTWLVAPRARIGLCIGIFVIVLVELALAPYGHGLNGYLQLLVQPVVLVMVVGALRLLEPTWKRTDP